ncbi:MAG TPA: hypothetical protein VFL63_02025 [Rhodanobacteraceae bacterium]|jgi:hypothetical protein|nr:hypothetical protein [Rhodanobacteraceae bacterium]
MRKLLTGFRNLRYVRSMPQRNIPRSLTLSTRVIAVERLPLALGTLLIALVLVLLISHGGAG